MQAGFSEKRGGREKVRLFHIVLASYGINRSNTIEAAECLVKHWCITFMFSKAAGTSWAYADMARDHMAKKAVGHCFLFLKCHETQHADF